MEEEHDYSLIVLALAIALERTLGLEKNMTIVEEQLREEQKRNSLMFEELKAAVVPAHSRNLPRPWWRFWDSPQ